MTGVHAALRPPAVPAAAAAPDFLVPRPTAPPAAREAPDDPWRERIAQIEVQLSATRAAGSRTGSELAAMRERLEAIVAQLQALEASTRQALERIEREAEQARQVAERPLPLQELEARLSETESIAKTARAAHAALRHELAENRRLDEARAARLASIEDRVAQLAADPRPDELRLAIDRVEARALALAREHEALRARLDALQARSIEQGAQLDRALASLDALRDRLERSAPSVPAERASASAAERASSSRARPRSEARPFAGIAGLGPQLQRRLREAGIADAAALAVLAASDRDRIAAAIGVRRERLDAWCAAAAAVSKRP